MRVDLCVCVRDCVCMWCGCVWVRRFLVCVDVCLCRCVCECGWLILCVGLCLRLFYVVAWVCVWGWLCTFELLLVYVDVCGCV